MTRLYWLLLIVVATGVVGCDKLQKGGTDTTIPAKGLDPNKEPDFKVSADDYYAEFKKDLNATKAKYADKVVEITGVLEGYGKNFGGEVQVLLAVKGQPLGVICFTKDKNPWNSAEPGQTVTMRGSFPPIAITGSPVLVECQIISATGPKAVTIKAEDLGKEFDADPKATQEKYSNKKVFITGIVETKKEMDKSIRVIFKTTSKVKVVASFMPSDKADGDKVPKGQQARIYGEFSTLYADDGEVAIGGCLYAPEK